jgi:hypothetical protein
VTADGGDFYLWSQVGGRENCDMIIKMRYVLRMVGIAINRPALLLRDNNSVVLNTSVFLSVLKTKHHACSYHRVWEAIAGGIMRFMHIPRTTNYVDVLSKPLPNDMFYGLIKLLLFVCA